MRYRFLSAAAAACLLASLAHAAEKAPASVGTVTARTGSCVVVFLTEGVSVKSGDVLETHRALLLGALAQDGKRVDAWAKWESTGKIRLRVLRGTRFAVGFVLEEVARTGLTGQPVPNILAGDVVRPPAKP